MSKRTKQEIMRYTIQLVKNTIDENKGGPFGAVIVRDGEIIGEGVNCVVADNDPTMHAEIAAIRDACKKLNTFDLSGCEIYITCEPCPMCLGAIYWARIRHVYFASTRHDAAAVGFDDADFHQELSLSIEQRKIQMTQVMRDEVLELYEIWNAKEDKVRY